MRYEGIAKRISRRYSAVVDNGTYYLNKEGNVVAYENSHKNLLVMYVKENGEIWTHYGLVAIAVVKDFVLTSRYQKKIADVIVVKGLCGAVNSIKRTSNRLLEAESSNKLDIKDEDMDEEKSEFDLCEPLEIIDYGALTSPQFKGCEIQGARIDVMVRDSTGKKAIVPYVVGEGLTRYISTMGHITSSNVIDLEIGIRFDIPKLFTEDSISININNLKYGVLSFRRTRKRKSSIEAKDYDVYNFLRKSNFWYWDRGYNTTNSDRTRRKISMTKNGTNYHYVKKVTCLDQVKSNYGES